MLCVVRTARGTSTRCRRPQASSGDMVRTSHPRPDPARLSAPTTPTSHSLTMGTVHHEPRIMPTICEEVMSQSIIHQPSSSPDFTSFSSWASLTTSFYIRVSSKRDPGIDHRRTPLRVILTAGSPSRALRVIVLP